jgi:preprotein translocase subunit Sec61beta
MKKKKFDPLYVFPICLAIIAMGVLVAMLVFANI